MKVSLINLRFLQHQVCRSYTKKKVKEKVEIIYREAKKLYLETKKQA